MALPLVSIAALVVAAPPAFTVSQDRLEVLEQAEKALAAAPDDPRQILKTALLRKMAGRYDESIELLASCKVLQCQLMLAISASMTDDAVKVLPFLEKLTRLEQPKEDLASAYRFYSQALVRAGRPLEAIAAARSAIVLQDAPMMQLDLAVAQFSAGKVTEAEATLDGALAKMPAQQTALYWKYRCLAHRADKAAPAAGRTAYDALVKAVSDKLQDRGDLHFLLAELAADLGEKERARTHREIAARLHVTRNWPAPKPP